MKQTGVQKKTGRIALLSVVGLISYSGFLVANLPAEKLWQYLPTDQLPIKPAGFSGTIWSGATESVTLTTPRQTLILPSVRWQIKPASMLKGKLEVDVELGALTSAIEGSVTVTLSQHSVHLERVELNTTAQWLASAIHHQIPGDLVGNVQLQVDRLTINEQGCTELTGSAELANSQLQSAFGLFDLGNSTAKLSCREQQFIARINQRSSMVSSESEFKVGMNGSYSFTGKVTPDSSLPETIKEGLNLLGKPDGNGNYPFFFKSSLT